MRTLTGILLVVAAGCSQAPRQATTGHIPDDVPACITRLACGMSAQDVDRALKGSGLDIGRMGDSFHWDSASPLGTNYSLLLSFDPKLNTILIKDRRRNVLFSRTILRQNETGLWQPVWTPEKAREFRQCGMRDLRKVTAELETKVNALRAEMAGAVEPDRKKQELEQQEKILVALKKALEEELANQVPEDTARKLADPQH